MPETIISDRKYGEPRARVEAPTRLCDFEDGRWLQDALTSMAELSSSCRSDAAGLRARPVRPSHWIEQAYECMTVSKGKCSTTFACELLISPKHQKSDRIQVEVASLSK
jgi:hypothetical protein